MDPKQNPNKRKERQTGIIDDAAAIAMAEAQAQNGRKGGGKKGFAFSKAQNAATSKPYTKTASQNVRAPKAKPAPKNGRPPKSTAALNKPAVPEAQVYDEDGLRVPLFDKHGKKKLHARSGNVLAQKLSKHILLGIVKDYAGEAKMVEFEAAQKSRNELGRWIETVETQAYGSGPRGKGAAPEQEQAAVKLAPTKAQQKAKAIADNPDTKSERNIFPSPNGHNKRKHDDDVTATSLDQQTKKKTKTKHSQLNVKPLQSSILTETTRPQQNPYQPKNSQPQTHSQAAKEDMAPKRKSPQHHPKHPSGPSPRKQTVASPDVPHHTVPAAQTAGMSKKQPAVVDKDAGLYIPKIDILPRDKQHPLIDPLDLNPHWDPIDPDSGLFVPSTRVLNLPDRRAHAIITAESETAVHVTEISYRDIKKERFQQSQQQGKQRQEAAPYLKPGLHGYDTENHCWHFASDPDLRTGIGHQVEPADAATCDYILLRFGEQFRHVAFLSAELRGLNVHNSVELEEEMRKLKELEAERFYYRTEYREKYPGTLASQWPCGCAKMAAKTGAWEDGDSEAE